MRGSCYFVQLLLILRLPLYQSFIVDVVQRVRNNLLLLQFDVLDLFGLSEISFIVNPAQTDIKETLLIFRHICVDAK